MKRCLVLLTTAYPYNPGEPYLETEMPYLAERFDRILLLPIGIAPGAKVSVPLPENVTLCNSAVLSPKRARITDCLRGTTAVLHLPQLPEADLREVRHSPAKRAFLGYFLARTRRHTEEILGAVRDFDFSPYEEVVLYSYWFFVAAAVGAELRKALPATKFISRAHGYDLYPYANALDYLPCRTMLLQAVDGVYACSEDGKQFLTKQNPDFSDTIHCAYLGTPEGTLTEGSVDGVFRILTCARTVPLKRLDRLADALTLLPDTPIEWTHIGDGPELSALQKKCAARHNVRFLGALSHEQVLDYYRTNPVDLFVNISKREGLPVAVMEALSYGVPAVVTDVGGCRELIDDGQNGFLLPADFTDAMLAKTLRKAFACGRELRRNAFQKYQENFSAAQNFSRFADLLCRADEGRTND
ncbi:MAG: glycosyltransferase [Acutalibacteraceae bacterium]